MQATPASTEPEEGEIDDEEEVMAVEGKAEDGELMECGNSGFDFDMVCIPLLIGCGWILTWYACLLCLVMDVLRHGMHASFHWLWMSFDIVWVPLSTGTYAFLACGFVT